MIHVYMYSYTQVCSPELMLLATGGTDMHVNLYDLKTLKLEHDI